MRQPGQVITLLLLLTACSQRESSQLPSDDEVRTGLSGTWVIESRYADGAVLTNVITVAPNGDYVCKSSIHSASNHTWTVELEGTWRVENGTLVDNMTKYDHTNSPYPRPQPARIVRFDGGELQVEYEKSPGVAYRTNPVIFRKQPN